MKIHARDYRVEPGNDVGLKDWPTRVKHVYKSDKDYRKLLQAHTDKSYAFSVTTFDFPVQRALRLTDDGALDAMYPEHRLSRSQDLDTAWHDAAQFYWGRAAAWRRGDTLFSPVALPVALPRHFMQDIDTLEDWQRAEWIYAALRARGELAA